LVEVLVIQDRDPGDEHESAPEEQTKELRNAAIANCKCVMCRWFKEPPKKPKAGK
jgi:hypothetical protein